MEEEHGAKGTTNFAGGNEDKIIDNPILDSLPPGYRYEPTDVELIKDYLDKKIKNQPLPDNNIRELQLYEEQPYPLFAKYKPKREKESVYVFTKLQKKYANGQRLNRVNSSGGHWKASQKPKPISDGCRTIGNKRALVFHLKGDVKTNWLMQEYSSMCNNVDEWVLCKIYRGRMKKHKNGMQVTGDLVHINESNHRNSESVPPPFLFDSLLDSRPNFSTVTPLIDSSVPPVIASNAREDPGHRIRLHFSTTGFFDGIDQKYQGEQLSDQDMPNCYFADVSNSNSLIADLELMIPPTGASNVLADTSHTLFGLEGIDQRQSYAGDLLGDDLSYWYNTHVSNNNSLIADLELMIPPTGASNVIADTSHTIFGFEGIDQRQSYAGGLLGDDLSYWYNTHGSHDEVLAPIGASNVIVDTGPRFSPFPPSIGFDGVNQSNHGVHPGDKIMNDLQNGYNADGLNDIHLTSQPKVRASAMKR